MGGLVVVVAAAGCSGSSAPPRQAIASIWLTPVPEGPQLAACRVVDRVSGCGVALSAVADAIPRPLPQPLGQPGGCEQGGDVVVRFKGGDVLTYGPCRLPSSIQELRLAIIDAGHEH